MLTEKLALGTVQFGLDYGISNKSGKTNREEAHKILNYCYLNGINLIDTARTYGNSEEVIGTFKPLDFSIVTKFLIDSDYPSLQLNLESSLQRLDTSTLYAFMAHDAEQFRIYPLLWDDLQKLKSEGKVQKIGYSLYYPKQLQQLLDKGKIPDIVQVPYNIFDKRFESLFPQLKEIGCEIHTRSAFLQGLFFMNIDLLSEHFEPIKIYLKELQHLFKQKEELAAYLLKFCLNNIYIDKVLFAVNSLEQLKTNLKELAIASSLNLGDIYKNIIVPESILIPSNWPVKQ